MNKENKIVYVIDQDTPFVVAEEAAALLASNKDFQAKRAFVNYNSKHFSEEFPLIIEGTKDGRIPVIVKVPSVACGFVGMATYATLAVLRTFGFNVKPNDIMSDDCATPDGWFHLTYTR